jgi:hypothetical protein
MNTGIGKFDTQPNEDIPKRIIEINNEIYNITSLYKFSNYIDNVLPLDDIILLSKFHGIEHDIKKVKKVLQMDKLLWKNKDIDIFTNYIQIKYTSYYEIIGRPFSPELVQGITGYSQDHKFLV